MHTSARRPSGLGLRLAAAAFLAACGSPSGSRNDASDVRDGGTSDGDAAARARCQTDFECDDHVFCNGAERCVPGTIGASSFGCVAAAPASPCAPAQTCNEVAQRCAAGCTTDVDGDGHMAIDCGGDDCDDLDPRRFPGNTEVCNGHDEDCDPCTVAGSTDGDTDADMFLAATCFNMYVGSTPTLCDPRRVRVAAGMARVQGSDCDDGSASVNPATAETCDGADNNCNGPVDEGVTLTFHRDCDGDGYGDATLPSLFGCDPSQVARCMGFAATLNGTDCNDARPDVHPGGTEICDAMRADENCNGSSNEGCGCNVGDTLPCGMALPGCPMGTQTCSSGSFGPCSVSATVLSCYGDADGDGYAPAAGAVTLACTCPLGTTTRAPSGPGQIDCNDLPPTGGSDHPGVVEVCDGRDNDCNGLVDENLHLTVTGLVPQSSFPLCTDITAWGREPQCARGVAEWCSSPAARGAGECAYDSGFGHLEINTSFVVVGCTVADQKSSIALSQLTAINAGCVATRAGYSACRSAANRLCTMQGRAGGYAYPTAVAGSWTLDCFASGHAEFRGTDWATLTAALAGTGLQCTSPSDGWPCNVAIHRYCVGNGFVTGFGPVEQSATVAGVVCLRRW